jgi:hypothetical protein
MMVFAIGIELARDVSVQCPHDAEARKHRRPAVAFGDQDQDFNGSLPFLELLFGLMLQIEIYDATTKTRTPTKMVFAG